MSQYTKRKFSLIWSMYWPDTPCELGFFGKCLHSVVLVTILPIMVNNATTLKITDIITDHTLKVNKWSGVLKQVHFILICLHA